MADYKMTAKEAILTSGSSRGSQIKFYKDNHWYKIDESGPEGKAEELASKILSCSNLEPDNFVKYESCTIEYEGKTYNGCRSKDFLAAGEQLISYEKIYKLTTGRLLSEDIILLGPPEEKIDFVAKMVKDFCELDVKEHIAKNLTASMVLLDTDRHLNNIAIIADADLNHFRNAPIFDNGASFLSNYSIYPPSITEKDIENERITVTGKPFSANLEYQAAAAGFAIRFDFDKIHNLLKHEPYSRMRNIATYLINKYEKIPDLQYTRNYPRKPQKTVTDKITESLFEDSVIASAIMKADTDTTSSITDRDLTD